MGLPKVIVRMDPVLVERIDQYAQSASGLIPGVRLTRSDAVRALVLLGLEKAGIGNPADVPEGESDGDGGEGDQSTPPGELTGADLRDWRHRQGMTQEEASARLVVSHSAVAQYEESPEDRLPEFLANALARCW